jgi:hypothetical protein
VDLRRLAPSTVMTTMAAAPRRPSWYAAALFAVIVFAIVIALLVVTNPGDWRARLFGGAPLGLCEQSRCCLCRISPAMPPKTTSPMA